MRFCIYCGQKTKKGRRGEHIVPEMIGGKKTLNDVGNRPVCGKCNNGILSQLDEELCKRSYLGLIASRELKAKDCFQAWEVDETSSRLLVEARPDWREDGVLNSFTCYPQIVFEQSGPEVRGDFEQFKAFGDDAINALLQAVRDCFHRYQCGEDCITFQRVDSPGTLSQYRLPPRIYTPKDIFKVAKDIKSGSFILRFVSTDDRKFAIASLANLNLDSLQSFRRLDRARTLERSMGSKTPAFAIGFDISRTVRALMKMGFNLIAAHCPKTPADSRHFSKVINVIFDRAGQMPREVIDANGFTYCRDLDPIEISGNAHSFRLVHENQIWNVYFRFFGGAICAYARVPGPNYEDWCCADIIAPLGSKEWEVHHSRLLPYMRQPRILWTGGEDLTPSVQFTRSTSMVSVKVVERKKRFGKSH